jgi:hypothetical protein
VFYERFSRKNIITKTDILTCTEGLQTILHALLCCYGGECEDGRVQGCSDVQTGIILKALNLKAYSS